MSKVEDFLGAGEEAEVVQAIIEAERNTSGEIRVHIEAHAPDPMKRAREVFRMLKMDNTRQANGVLLYIAVMDRKFAICGDQGIDRKVDPGFWDSTKDAMQNAFKKGRFKEGIVYGVTEAGKALKVHFPWMSDDQNELSDAVSKG